MAVPPLTKSKNRSSYYGTLPSSITSSATREGQSSHPSVNHRCPRVVASSGPAKYLHWPCRSGWCSIEVSADISRQYSLSIDFNLGNALDLRLDLSRHPGLYDCCARSYFDHHKVAIHASRPQYRLKQRQHRHTHECGNRWSLYSHGITGCYY